MSKSKRLNILPEGVLAALPVTDEQLDSKPLKLPNRGGLRAMADEYVYFTHGLLFTRARWSHDPVLDYIVEANPKDHPFIIELPKRAFVGLDFKNTRNRFDHSWCYKLLAIKKDGWDDLFRFMCTVGGIDRERGVFFRLMAQRIPVPDIIALERMIGLSKEGCPTIEVVTFGLDGNKRAVGFAPAINPPIDKPKVITRPPDPETIVLAQQVFAGNETPYKPIDQAYAEKRLADVKQDIPADIKEAIF